jgi:hypothetical protein
MRYESLTNPLLLTITSVSAFCTFILSYFFEIYLNNVDQYIAVVGVMFLDGIFGTIAGVKKEGFRTYKAIKILKDTFTWLMVLTTILMVEKGFDGTNWLSEVIIVPFMVFQIISALKNASTAGYIKAGLLNEILDKIDKHKGIRD